MGGTWVLGYYKYLVTLSNIGNVQHRLQVQLGAGVRSCKSHVKNLGNSTHPGSSTTMVSWCPRGEATMAPLPEALDDSAVRRRIVCCSLPGKPVDKTCS